MTKHKTGKLVLLVETENPGEAAIIRSKLEAFGVPCSVGGESASHLFGIMLDGLARTRIFVPEECLELAKEALKPGITDTSEDS